MDEIIIDMRDEIFKKHIDELVRSKKICEKLNSVSQYSSDHQILLKELFGSNMDKTAFIVTPFNVDIPSKMVIGKNVYINNNFDCLAAGGIEIGDDVMIGPSVLLTTSNHDLKDHQVLRLKPIVIKEKAWIAAKAIILPGVTIGIGSVIGAGAVVTKSVPDYEVWAGNPAHFIKKINV